jgi:uncharacterized protein YidB (DUF937 family)
MGLLDGLVGQIAKQALGGNGAGQQPNLGNMIGGLLGGQQGGALGNVLGSVLGGAGQGGAGGGQLAGILGQLLGGQGGKGGIPPQLLMALVPVVLGFIQKNGGVEKLLGALSNSGMGAQAQSWINQGENQPMDPSHAGQLFGMEQISQLAAQHGVDAGVVSKGLSALLPEIVNQLTPDGNTGNAATANAEIGQLLGALLK